MVSLDSTNIHGANDLVAAIERRIGSGELGPGQRLPSVRHTATALALSPTTVASAYRRLRDRGVVVGRGRQGTVVADRPQVAPVVPALVPDGVIDAMTGNPDARLLPDLGPAFSYALRQPARYGDALVVDELRNVGQEQFEADGIEATNLTVASGAMDAVQRVLEARLRPGDAVGVEDPGYAAVYQLLTAIGLRAVPVAIDQQGPIPNALSAALHTGIQAMVMAPRSQNPTGAALSAQRQQDLSAILDAHASVLVIEDDHAGPIAGAPARSVNHGRDRWATVRSVAKAFGPDLRVALIAGDKETIDRVEARQQVGPGWVSHLLQRASSYLMADTATQHQVAKARDIYRDRREHLLGLLGDAGIVAQASSGLHVWVPVADEHAVVSAMRDSGFAVRAGAAYRIGAPPALRITTASLSTRDTIRLAQALSSALDPVASRSHTA